MRAYIPMFFVFTIFFWLMEGFCISSKGLIFDLLAYVGYMDIFVW